MPNDIPLPVPPNPDGTCPDGMVLNTVDGFCYFVAPPIKVTSTGVSLPDVDPKNAGELTALGTAHSGIVERLALALWWALGRLGEDPVRDCGIKLPPALSTLTRWVVGRLTALLLVYDYIVCLGVDFIGVSGTRNNPGFWALIGGLLSDLLGVEVNGDELYRQLQTRGTVPAMQGVGASLVNLLIGEFTGTAGGTQGQVTFSSNVNPETGLPEAILTPAGGVKASQALMGFVLSSAVRQGNIDAIGESMGILGGHVEKFSEAMRSNLGIGKMLRFALRPIFQDLVAGPLKWAVNKQYRPKLFNAAEAARATLAEVYSLDQFKEECALDGYSDTRLLALLDQHTRRPALNELLILRASGQMDDIAFDRFLKRDGFDANSAALVREAHDLEPARRVALAVAEHQLLAYAQGNITGQALRDFVDGLKSLGFMLTPGEVTALEAVASRISTTVKLRPRHLSVGQLKKAYIDGTITLMEYEDHLRGLGYDESDVQILGIEVLIDAKHAQEAAAKHAAAAKKGAGPATSPTLNPPTKP